MSEEIQNGMITIVKAIKDTEKQWLQDNNESAIRKMVREKLDKQKTQLLLKYLGFDKDSWKRDVWKIDHCNGRSGNSHVGKTVNQIMQEECDEWLTVSVKNLIEEAFTELNLEKTLKEFVKSQLNYKFKDLIRETAREKMKAVMDKSIEEYLQHHVDELKFMEEMIGEE